MNSIKPEILAPGGDFNSAIHALKSGADAVYIGLKSFSARKKAKNFTIDELRRLKTFAVTENKKIYVAINTLLKDQELKEIFPLLRELETIMVNGIIVQDLGLASIIHNNTKIPLHASTQLAVHNIHGVKALISCGFSRVVLSRELSLKEITSLKSEFPNMEFEVFIHGALCYGFSGLCLASSTLLGRSANRGECGQICRTWFNNNGEKEYCFSLNDLSLEEKVLKLKEIGIESLKIEGRMKGPGYAANTSKLYYNILNGNNYSNELKKTRLDFNRSGHNPYLIEKNHKNSVNVNYPGHVGIEIGTIKSINSDSFTVNTTELLENRDGILLLQKTTPYTPIQLAVNILNKTGSTITLKGKIPKNITGTLYKVSSHNKHLKEEKSQSYKPYKTKINLLIEIENKNILITGNRKTYTYPLVLEEAKSTSNIQQLFNKSFLAGGETPFTFPCNVVNKSEITNPFIPASKIKEIRNLFQKEFTKDFKLKEYLILNGPNIQKKSYIRNSNPLPFITNFNNVNINNLTEINGKLLLPLAPVEFDSEKYLLNLKGFLNNNSDKKYIIGLNNVFHFEYIKELPSNLEYYCDYGLYSTNKETDKFIASKIQNLLWITKWIEDDKVKDSPPLFISRTCFKAQKNGCPDNCKKQYTFNITQGRKYKIIVEECISYTLAVLESN